MKAEPMTIGEAARRAGVATSTIRYYERRGLLVADERRSGQRRFQEATLRRLVFIGMLQDAGLSLDDIAAILGAPDVATWKAIAVERLLVLEAEIERLERARSYLQGALLCRFDHPAIDCHVMGAEIDRRLAASPAAASQPAPEPPLTRCGRCETGSGTVGSTDAGGDPMTDNQVQLIEEMFVQVAQGATSSDGSLTLLGLSPSTLYFSDRPERVVGHMTTEQFVEQWTKGPDSFESDPPNAVLSFVADGQDTPSDVVVVLREPSIGDGSVTYSIDVLEGAVPAAAGPCTLFIDPLGRPLSPVSAAGMHRRDRRRMRRRF